VSYFARRSEGFKFGQQRIEAFVLDDLGDGRGVASSARPLGRWREAELELRSPEFCTALGAEHGEAGADGGDERAVESGRHAVCETEQHGGCVFEPRHHAAMAQAIDLVDPPEQVDQRSTLCTPVAVIAPAGASTGSERQ